jgi:O-antigen ligase
MPASSGVVLLALTLPLLLLHESFQPSLTLSAGGTDVELRLADLGVLAVAAAAAAVAAGRRGRTALRPGLPVWIAAGAFLAFTFVATFYPLAFANAYPWRPHLVTAFKYAEYALLAPSVALLVRRRSDVLLLAVAFTTVSAAATVAGLLQFAGVPILAAWPAGGRQPSFVGVDDFGAVSAAAYAIALAIVAVGPRTRLERRLAWAAGISGGLGIDCAGALAGVLGALLAAAGAALVGRYGRLLSLRRAVALGLMAAVVLAGGILMRGSALHSFANFLGVGEKTEQTQVESYSHRWVLNYVGLRMFAGRPLLGSGWQSGYDEEAYGPYLADAKARFPDQPPLAFPSPQHPWGIQNAYVQALAELGIVGFALFVAMILAGLGKAARTLRRLVPAPTTPALLGLLWLLVAAGMWNSLWLIAGIPFDAVIWLGFGLAATALRPSGEPDRDPAAR